MFAVTADHERIGMDNNSMHNGAATHKSGHLTARAQQPVRKSRRERDPANTMSELTLFMLNIPFSRSFFINSLVIYNNI